MKYQNSDYTVLVNYHQKYNPADYLNFEYMKIMNTDGKTICVEKKTYEQFTRLKEHMQKLGITIGIVQALRNEEEQKNIYINFCDKYGKDYSDKVVAPVGESEHHTGLALDIEIYQKGKWISNNDNFEIAELVLKTIHPYLSKYGFILRYPKGKEKITHIVYEPWHIRYVGEELASYLENNDLTLDEYK